MKVQLCEPDPLCFDEMMRLLDAFEGLSSFYRRRNELIALVLFHCALRVSELVSLDLGQVGLEGRLFFAVRRKRAKLLSAPFNDVVAEALENYLDERAKLATHQGEAALFLSDCRCRISVRAVQKMIARYAQAAGIGRPVTPHLLRHSSATQFVAFGTPLSVVQGICGHTSVTTTQRYVHVSTGQRRDAVEQLGDAWEKRRRERQRPS